MRPNALHPASITLLSVLLLFASGACASSDESASEPAPAVKLPAPESAPAMGPFDEANAAFQAGRYADAAAAYERALAADPEAGQGEGGGEEWFRYGYALHVSGELQRALAAHERATAFPRVAPIAAYNLACAHALLGHPDEAFAALDRAVGYGFKALAQLDGDPDLASLRADPRWAGLRERVEAAGTGG